MNESETHTEKELARAALLAALVKYFTLATVDGMTEKEQALEVEALFEKAGRKWPMISF